MNERPTPETDDATLWKGADFTAFVPAAFARKLERERDEAREELADLKAELESEAIERSLIE